MIWCFIICFGMAKEPPTIVDSYCQTYQRVVRSPRDLDQVLKMDRSVRDLIQGNDLEYLCRCLRWNQDPKKRSVCASTKQ